jgi:hypothetical protein
MGTKFWFSKRDKMNPAARLKFMCKVNIKKDIVEVGCDGLDWINLIKTGDKRRALLEAEVKRLGDLRERLSALVLGF